MAIKRLSDYLPKEEEDIVNKTQKKVARKLSDYLPSDTSVPLNDSSKGKTPDPFARRDILNQQVPESSRLPDFVVNESNKENKPRKFGEFKEGTNAEKFRKFLYGDKQSLKKSFSDDGFLNSIARDGVIGTLLPTLTDSEFERKDEAYQRLVKTSGKTRANELINKSKIAGFGDFISIDVDLTDVEKSALNDIRISRKLGLALDLFDSVGVAGSQAIKKMDGSRNFFTGLIRKAFGEETTTGIRSVITKEFPQLKGTKELDDLTDTITFANSKDGEEVIEKIHTALGQGTRTPSDKVVYKDGVPTIQRAQDTAGAIAERNEIRTILRGDGEATRLADEASIAEEIRLGSLPIKTTAEDTITVFRLEKLRGSKPVLGERVVTSEKFADGATSLEVKVSDLVKTSKGDYAYAPADVVAIGPLPTNLFKQASLAGGNAKDVLKTEKKTETKKMVDKIQARKADEAAKKQQIKDIDDAKKEPARLKAESDKALKVELDKTKREVDVARKAKTANLKKASEQLDKDILEVRKASIDKMAKLRARRKTPARDKAIISERAKLQERIRAMKSKSVKAKVKENKNFADETSKIKKESSERLKSNLSESKLKRDAADSKLREIKESEKAPKKESRKKTETDTVEPKEKKVKEKAEDKNVVTNTDGSFKELTPVGRGEIKKSTLYERVVRNSKEVVDSNILDGASEEYRVAHQTDSIADAVGYIDHVGVDAALDALTVALRTGSQVADGVLNNAVLVALEGRLLEKGAVKNLDKLMRLASQVATKAGQDVNILNMLTPDNPLRVLAKTEKAMKEASKSKDKTDMIVKQIQQKIEKGTNPKSIAKEAIDKLIC